MAEKNKPENPERPEQMVDEIVAYLDTRHEALVEETTRIGYYRDQFKKTRHLWKTVGDINTDDPEIAVIRQQAVNSLTAYRDELRSTERVFQQDTDRLRAATPSAGTPLSTAGATVSFFPLSSEFPQSISPVVPPPFSEMYGERLSHFDLSLGRTYQEIWEILYGTRSDPERGSLYLIRQAFDHLFEKLAPDDEVRKSPFWRKKPEGPENQVTREERISFAADRWVKDKARANTLTASSKHMLSVYQGLNSAHKRGALDALKARHALEEMQSILADWVDAIGA